MTRARLWFARGTLGFATLIFAMIGAKYVLHPAAAAAESGLSFLGAFGRTNLRAGVGGFTLGCGLVTLACLLSAERLRTGLWFILAMVVPVLIVRLYGVAVDGTLQPSLRILVAEAVLFILASLGLVLARRPAPRRASPSDALTAT